jgi:glycosyltransferase involved in cell wall biosynthesis
VGLRTVAQSASAVHALSPLERDILYREYFPKSRIEVIPNGISVANLGGYVQNTSDHNSGTERWIVFLGRLHPVKGVDFLIWAFANAAPSAWRLVIAGPPYSKTYDRYLRYLARQTSAASRIQFIGAIADAY